MEKFFVEDVLELNCQVGNQGLLIVRPHVIILMNGAMIVVNGDIMLEIVKEEGVAQDQDLALLEGGPGVVHEAALQAEARREVMREDQEADLGHEAEMDVHLQEINGQEYCRNYFHDVTNRHIAKFDVILSGCICILIFNVFIIQKSMHLSFEIQYCSNHSFNSMWLMKTDQLKWFCSVSLYFSYF